MLPAADKFAAFLGRRSWSFSVPLPTVVPGRKRYELSQFGCNRRACEKPWLPAGRSSNSTPARAVLLRWCLASPSPPAQNTVPCDTTLRPRGRVATRPSREPSARGDSGRGGDAPLIERRDTGLMRRRSSAVGRSSSGPAAPLSQASRSGRSSSIRSSPTPERCSGCP
jgi:hypothetical protein